MTEAPRRSLRAAREGLARLRERARGDESGFTFIELLVSMIILGLAVIPVVTGLGVLAKTSAGNRLQVNVGAVARDAAEAIKGSSYQSCTSGSPINVYKAVLAAPAFTSTATAETDPSANKISVVVNSVTTLDGNTVLAAGCASDPGLQLISVTATSKYNNVSEQLWFVKAQVAPTS